jgi:hypothetical protein
VLVNLFVTLCAFAAITVAISDMCLGEQPGVLRSYRRLRGPVIRRLAWANIIQLAVLAGATLLLVIPGLIMMVRLLFTPIVATLENCRGVAALKRSAALGKGMYWRNAGVLLVLIAVFFGLGIAFGLVNIIIALALGTGIEGGPQSVSAIVTRTGTALVTMLTYPLMFTAMTLMYYDMRVRKESYDLNTLAEDLRR